MLNQLNSKWWLWLELALVLAVAIIPRVLTLGGTFVVNDETLYWRWSNQFTTALLSRDWAATLIGNAYPSVTVMWVQVFGFALRWLWVGLTGALDPQFYAQLALDRPLDFALLGQRRLAMGLANAGVVVLMYLYIRRLWGRGVALVAVIVLALDPFYLSDARTMRGDSLMAGLMTLSVLGLLLARRAELRWRQLVFSAVMAGLSLLTKMSAAPLVLFGGLVLVGLGLAQAWPAGVKARWRCFWRIGLWPALIWGAVIVFTCFALWPALWVAPGQVLQAMSAFGEGSADGRPTYFMGRHAETELFPLFYPVTLFFRSTPLTLIGLCLFLVAGVVVFMRRRKQLLTPGAVEFGLLALYSLLYTSAMTAGLLKRGWYILPVVPVVIIVAAWGWVWLAKQARQRWTALLPPLLGTAMGLAAMLVIQVVQAIPAHPYYYAYWNPLARGIFTPTRLEMLSWGLDVALAGQWLNTQPNPEQLKVALRPSTREMEPVFNGELIPFTDERPWVQANYIVLRERHVQLEEDEPYLIDYLHRLTPVYTLTLNNVTFGWIYPGPAAQVAPNSKLAGKAILLGYDPPSAPLAVGQPVSLKVYWQNQGLAAGDYLFVRLVDEAGFVWNESQVTPLPGFEEAALTTKQIAHSQVVLTAPMGMPPGIYFLRSGVYSRARQETLGYFDLPAGADRVTVVRPSKPPSAAELTLDHKLAVKVSPEIALLGFSLPGSTLVLNGDNWVRLYWQTETDVTKDYVINLQLIAADGKEAAYWLGRPVLGRYATTAWSGQEIISDPWRLTLPAEMTPGPYTLRLTLFDGQTQVSQVELGAVSVVKRRQQFDLPTMQQTLRVNLQDGATLLGYDVWPEPLTGGGRLQVTLYWQAQQPIVGDYTVFVQLLNAAGVLVAQHDGLPVGGTIPTKEWAAGEVIADRHLLEFKTLPQGEYRLVAGLYNTATGARLSVSGGDTFIPLQTLSIK